MKSLEISGNMLKTTDGTKKKATEKFQEKQKATQKELQL